MVCPFDCLGRRVREMNENILKAVKEARESSKRRGFLQSFDLVVNLKLIDLKKPENKLNEVFALPKGRGKDAKVVLFSDAAKGVDCSVYSSADIDRLAKDKRGLKKISRDIDFFLSEPKLMPVIGKSLGRVLAPRGKMPSLVVGDPKAIVEQHKKSVRIKVKDSPVIQCAVGIEKMRDEDVVENIEAVLGFLEKKLQKGKNNIGRVFVKLTMGKRIRLEI